MKKYVGIWLDHVKSNIISVSQKEELFSVIESHIENHRGEAAIRQSPSSHLLDAALEGKTQEKRKQILHRYYQEIIKNVKSAEKLLIFGPGEAKIELEKEILKCKDFAPHLTVEPADRMSNSQISAKVRKFFRPYL